MGVERGDFLWSGIGVEEEKTNFELFLLKGNPMDVSGLEVFGKYGGVPGLILLAVVLILWAVAKTGVLGKVSGTQAFILLMFSIVALFLSFCFWIYKIKSGTAHPASQNHLYRLTISGHIEDADEHFSVDGVTISFDGQQYKTANDGNFLFIISSKDSPTTARILLVKVGYESYIKTVDMPSQSLQLVMHKESK
jgi:hypothetical protein